MRRLLFAAVVALPLAVFAAGTGTKADPYTISTVEELVQFRDAVNAGDNSFNDIDMSDGGAGLYFKLTEPVDLKSVCGESVGNWAPIGTEMHPFRGHFDGGNNQITNFYMDAANLDNELIESLGYGLFGVGSSAGDDTLTISNVILSPFGRISVNSNNASVGSVLGLAIGNVLIENCSNNLDVSGRMEAGGIVGKIDDGNTVIVRNCTNNSTVNSGYGYAGGIAGYIYASDGGVFNCYNKGSLVQGGYLAAGLVGHFYSWETATIESCENLADISSGRASAGIAISVENVSFVDVYNGGHVQASAIAAGIADTVFGCTFSKCVNQGDIFAGTLGAGIAGFDMSNESSYEKCLNFSTVEGMQYAGGIVGISKQNEESKISFANNIIVGDVSGEMSGSVYGGCGAGTCDEKYNIDSTNMVVDNLPEGFVSADWEMQKGYYPQIKELASHKSEKIRKASILAATPALSVVTPAGLGSKDDPLTITSLTEFLQFRDAVNDSSEYKGVKLANGAKGLWFSLRADIDLSSVCGEKIGSWKPIGPFAGNFNGRGHKISNLYMDETSGSGAGLFGSLFGDSDTLFINDVVMEGVVMDFDVESVYGGAIAAQAVRGKVVISGVDIKGLDVTLKGDGKQSNVFSVMVGGVIGNTVAEWLRVDNSFVMGEVKVFDNEAYVGGIIGSAPSPLALHDNDVAVNIESHKSHGDLGGLVGEMVAKFDIVNNVSSGNIKGDSLEGYPFVGGIFGVNPYAPDGSRLENCKNEGDIEVSGTDLAVGGIAGFLSGNEKVTIKNVINEGKVSVTGIGSSEPIVGGVAGIYNVVVADSLANSGTITVKNASFPFAGGVAGLVRDLKDTITLKNCENYGDIMIQNDNEKEDNWVVSAAGLVGNAGESKAVVIEGRSVADGKIDVSGKALLREAFVATVVYVKGSVPVITGKNTIDNAKLSVKEITPKENAGDDTDDTKTGKVDDSDDGEKSGSAGDDSDGKKSGSDGDDSDGKKSGSDGDKKDDKKGDKKSSVIAGLTAPTNFAIMPCGRTLQIARAVAGAKYAVFDMQGNMVRSGELSNGVTSVQMPAAGSYLVKIGLRTKMFSVK